jgi:hypothetical protein
MKYWRLIGLHTYNEKNVWGDIYEENILLVVKVSFVYYPIAK